MTHLLSFIARISKTQLSTQTIYCRTSTVWVV
uniref:Uncharacterized protein n=1 Tax=Rhizophora mucronata TaxID=61149 RepID=A0A2P2IHD5_RHIMU